MGRTSSDTMTGCRLKMLCTFSSAFLPWAIVIPEVREGSDYTVSESGEILTVVLEQIAASVLHLPDK
jgi:hypothetical protein